MYFTLLAPCKHIDMYTYSGTHKNTYACTHVDTKRYTNTHTYTHIDIRDTHTINRYVHWQKIPRIQQRDN